MMATVSLNHGEVVGLEHAADGYLLDVLLYFTDHYLLFDPPQAEHQEMDRFFRLPYDWG